MRSASTLHEGVYLAVGGPSFETPGRDPRVPHARRRRGRHVDRATRRSSPATRACASPRCRRSPTSPRGCSEEPLSHEQTLRDAARAASDLAPLITRFVEDALTVLAAELIRTKREGGELTADEIGFLVDGITDGSVSDAQVGALAMAIVWRGMSKPERDRADRRDDATRATCSTWMTATASSTSTPPAASATRSACCSRRSSPPAAARCR